MWQSSYGDYYRNTGHLFDKEKFEEILSQGGNNPLSVRKNKKVILANASLAIPLKAAFYEAKQTQYESSLPSDESRYTQYEPKNTSGYITVYFAFGKSRVLNNSKLASYEARKASPFLFTFSALGQAKALYSTKSQVSCEVKALSSAKSQASSEVKALSSAKLSARRAKQLLSVLVPLAAQ